MDQNLIIYFSIGFIFAIVSGRIINKEIAPVGVYEYILVGFLTVIFGFGWPIALTILCLYGIGKLFSLLP